MRAILLLSLACLLSNVSKSQNYNYGALFAGIFVKAEGRIIVSESDSTVTLSSITNGNENTDSYKFVKRANRVIYFTDGVKTHSMIVNKENGKKKGFNYDTAIILALEGQTSSVTYYCKEE